MDVLLFFAQFAIQMSFFVFFVFSIFAIGKRQPKNRITGLVALLILFAVVTYSKLNPMPPGQGLPKFELNSQAEQGGALIANVLMFVGFWVLFFRFGFSEKSRKFFSQPNPARNTDAQNQRAS